MILWILFKTAGDDKTANQKVLGPKIVAQVMIENTADFKQKYESTFNIM